jgi:hypothetical protein
VKPGWIMKLSIQQVKAKHENRLMAIPGVVSVGLGQDKDGHMAIIVGLDRARPDIEDQLPRRLEGYPVVVQIVGSIKAL